MSEMNRRAVTQKFTAVGNSVTAGYQYVVFNLTDLLKYPQTLPPSILCKISPGGSLTYSIQVTGDDVENSTITPEWFDFDGMTGLTASQNGGLGQRVRALQVVVSAYTSGTLTVQVVI